MLGSVDKSKPVVVALSGGVDSSVAAAVLVDAGYQVVGITMRLFNAAGTVVSAGGRCCGPRDIEDARRVCQHLGIPFYVVDFEADFERDVVEDFVDAYLRGETPNPCVRCNQHIKFTPLLKRARALGAEIVVTGHYARLEAGEEGTIALRRGVDANKDQSYFLFSMPIDELAAVRFPLGGLRKHEVRELAEKHGLPNASKGESQEICFVPDGNYAGFVEARALARGRRLPATGPIVDGAGDVVGQHRGIHHYTIGQRRGLGDVGSDGKPVYVARIDVADNTIVVGDQASARRTRITVEDVRWFVDPPTAPIETAVQIRYRAQPVAATVTARGPTAEVHFKGTGATASPGQAAVFYDGDRVIGGGWVGAATDPGTSPSSDS